MNNNYLYQLSNKLAASISRQKDKLLIEVLSENNIDISDLTNLSKRGRFIHQKGKDYQIFKYKNKNLLKIYEPEIKYDKENFKISTEVKYKKLY